MEEAEGVGMSEGGTQMELRVRREPSFARPGRFISMILRPATWEDRQLLLRWRNDPVTVRSLPGAQSTLSDEHHEWMRLRIQHPDFYVAEDGGQPIGTVRLDPAFIISITIAPEYRGQGWATPVIMEAIQGVDHPVLAQVLLNNQASVRAFLNAGFRLEPGQWYRK